MRKCFGSLRSAVRITIIGICLSGCATTPQAPPVVEPENPTAGEYQIPVVKADGSIEQFTVDPDPEQTFLFCIEMPGAAVCIADQSGRAVQFVFPMPQGKGVGPGAEP